MRVNFRDRGIPGVERARIFIKDRNDGKAVRLVGPAATGNAACTAPVAPKQTLTLHDIAIERAALASQQLDLYMASMQGIGILKLFNAEFKMRRVAATADRGGAVVGG